MSNRGVSALDSGFDLRMNVSSVGLLAVRVATAAARRRAGTELNDRDRRAIRLVITDLTSEAKVLRGESSPDVDDETSYAFAGFALTALDNGAPASIDEAIAADKLDDIVQKLRDLMAEASIPEASMKEIEDLFLRASNMVSDRLGRAGELLDGSPASSTAF